MNIMNQSELLIYPDERVLPTNRVSISASLSENILHELKTFFHVEPKNARGSFMIEDGSKRIISKNAFENNIYVAVDSNGKIIDITNFYVPAEDEKIALFACEADFIPETVERDTFTENLISHMTDKLEGYELIADDFIDRDYRHLVWVRRLSNGIQNTFQNVKIIIDVPHQMVASYTSYDRQPNTYTAQISQGDALEAIHTFMETKCIPGEVENIELAYCQPNTLWDENELIVEDEVHLAYIARVSDGNISIYVDAVSGAIIGGSYFKSEDGGVFCANLSGFTHSKTLATNGFKKLGYTVASKNSAIVSNSSPIDSFWANNNSYAFFFSGHGTAAQIGNNSTWRLYPKDLGAQNDWHFVFLDACKTGAASTWAAAFGITNKSGSRGWLGWYDLVTTSASNLFNDYFWPMMTQYTLRDAALKAADKVPEAGSTPIRFYGDPKYYGVPWKK